jgi:hypothetical protein
MPGDPHSAIGSDPRSPAAVAQTPLSVPRSPLHTRCGRGAYVAHWIEAVTLEGYNAMCDTGFALLDTVGLASHRCNGNFGEGWLTLPKNEGSAAPVIRALCTLCPHGDDCCPLQVLVVLGKRLVDCAHNTPSVKSEGAIVTW